MKGNSLLKNSAVWLRLAKWKFRSAVAQNSYIDAMIFLNKIAIKDLESYAIYDPSSLFNIAIAIATFKPVEYCVEVAIGLCLSWWQGNKQKQSDR